MRYSKELLELLNHDEWYEQTEEGYFATKHTPDTFLAVIDELNKEFQNSN